MHRALHASKSHGITKTSISSILPQIPSRTYKSTVFDEEETPLRDEPWDSEPDSAFPSGWSPMSDDEDTKSFQNSLEIRKQVKQVAKFQKNQHSNEPASLIQMKYPPELQQMIPHSVWIPDKRKKSPMPEGLPPHAVQAVEAFENRLPFKLHEDTTRVLSLPKDLGGFGFTNLTPVQYRAMPLIAQGIDVLVRAPTGTGKTMAFLAPLVERLIYDRVDPYTKNFHILILCPTRELVLQTAKTTKHLLGLHNRSGARDYDVTTLVGSRTVVREEQQPLMESRTPILIATPGRIAQHIKQTPGFAERLKSVNMVVMDEVDYLLTLGFKNDISTVMNKIGKKRQTIMFSATLSPAVRLIAKYSLRKSHQVIDLIAVPDGGHKTPEDAIKAAALIANDIELTTNRPIEMNDVNLPSLSIISSTKEIENVGKYLNKSENQHTDDEGDTQLDLEAFEGAEDAQDQLMLAQYVAETPIKATQYMVECDIKNHFTMISRIFDDIGGRFKNAQDNILEHAESNPDLLRDIKLRPPKVLVFCPTARHAQFSASLFRQTLMCGDKQSPWQTVLELHSKKHQNHRVRMASEFGSNDWSGGVIMFASDVAARGMDFENVDMVIQVGLPASRHQYIHRVGRTARAGKSGQSLLVLAPFEMPVAETLLAGLPISLPSFEDAGISLSSAKERKAEEAAEEKLLSKAFQKLKQDPTSPDLSLGAEDEESDFDLASNSTPFNPKDYIRNINETEAIEETTENPEEVSDDEELNFADEQFGDEFTQSLLQGVVARAAAPFLLKEPILLAQKAVDDIANPSPVTANLGQNEANSLSPRAHKRHRAKSNSRNGVVSFIRTVGFGQPICETIEELEFQELERTRALTALTRDSPRSFDKAIEVYLRRVLKKVPSDPRLGLSAERAYVAFLGLHRLRSLKVKGTVDDPLALRLESVKRPQTGQTLDPLIVGLAAKEFANSMGLVGQMKDSDPPTVPMRIAARLGMENNPHLVVGVPKLYPQSEKPKLKQSKKAWPEHAAHKKNVQAKERVHYDKHAGPKRRPIYNRSGEMVYRT